MEEKSKTKKNHWTKANVDETKEVYIGWSEKENWFSDVSIFVNHSFPFFARGGYHIIGTKTGVFASYNLQGAGGDRGAFRTVLCP